jgi:hypothetical protein
MAFVNIGINLPFGSSELSKARAKIFIRRTGRGKAKTSTRSGESENLNKILNDFWRDRPISGSLPCRGLRPGARIPFPNLHHGPKKAQVLRRAPRRESRGRDSLVRKGLGTRRPRILAARERHGAAPYRSAPSPVNKPWGHGS